MHRVHATGAHWNAGASIDRLPPCVDQTLAGQTHLVPGCDPACLGHTSGCRTCNMTPGVPSSGNASSSRARFMPLSQAQPYEPFERAPQPPIPLKPALVLALGTCTLSTKRATKGPKGVACLCYCHALLSAAAGAPAAPCNPPPRPPTQCTMLMPASPTQLTCRAYTKNALPTSEACLHGPPMAPHPTHSKLAAQSSLRPASACTACTACAAWTAAAPAPVPRMPRREGGLTLRAPKRP